VVVADEPGSTAETQDSTVSFVQRLRALTGSYMDSTQMVDLLVNNTSELITLHTCDDKASYLYASEGAIKILGYKPVSLDSELHIGSINCVFEKIGCLQPPPACSHCPSLLCHC
jgi:hypothetical protein